VTRGTSETLRSVDRSHAKKTPEATIRTFDGLSGIFHDLAELLKPPERITISEAAEQYIKLNNPGSYIGPYRADFAPYMQEPMDELASRLFSQCVFVGPAQSGKTESLILGWIGYSVKVDPMDMIVYSPSQAAARDFSTRRVDRMHRNSPEIGSIMLKNRDSDNKFDKHYRTGMILNLSWPSVTEFAGRPIGRVALTDYDRMPDDIEGDGNPFDLGSKRTTTFRSFAMTLAESSPSRPVERPQWIRTSAHEAPPCGGILGLYNRGDRRRWYWPCPECGSYFEGNWTMLQWDTKRTIAESAVTTRMVCPANACSIGPDKRANMNLWGVWLKEGQAIDQEGRIVGEAVESRTASFWMNGTAAAFTTWRELVASYLTAMMQFDKTGSEDELKKFFNTDLGEPFIPKSAQVDRLPEVLKNRAEKFPYVESDADEPERIDRPNCKGVGIRPLVPDDVRFLVAAVDVQTNMFVVQVHGVMPGMPYDIAVIDRFSIRKSRRQDITGESLWVKPSSYVEDWQEITSEVMRRSYELSDGSKRRMMIRFTVCDSGGESGATTNAYTHYRELKEKGDAGRFMLVKGDPLASRPRTQITFPDSNRKDRFAAARGDVPVMLLNSNALKDSLIGRLESTVPGKGMFRFPDWLPDWWFSEICAETRTDKGWQRTSYKRNEGFDLSYYVLGACVSAMLNVEHIQWDNPPNWAKPWDTNDLILKSAQKEAFAKPDDIRYDFGAFGKRLA
jgi:phage terminase large subunit GpA-like protein